jgi:hypothetical protein
MEFTGISYGNHITVEQMQKGKAEIDDYQCLLRIPGNMRSDSLDRRTKEAEAKVSAFRAHVGDLRFSHWAVIHTWAPNGSKPTYILPMYCPPIFKKPEMLPVLYQVVKQHLAGDEFIYDIEIF